MGKKDIYIKKTEEYVLDIIKDTELILVDVEFVKELKDYYLRVYIDKKTGVSIDDCEFVSRQMNEILDREDYIDEAYIFEVSSSGDRPFKRDADFNRNLEQKIEIHLYKAVDGVKDFEGNLKGFDENSVTVLIEDKEMIFDRKNLSLVKKAF